jgi:hypothetical protein
MKKKGKRYLWKVNTVRGGRDGESARRARMSRTKNKIERGMS